MKSNVAGVLAPASSVASSWRAAWPFWLAVPVFLAGTLIDTGRAWTRILGQSPGLLTTALVLSLGLLNVRRRSFGVPGIATVIIMTIVAGHVLFRHETVLAAYRLTGSLAMMWVIASQRLDTKSIVLLLKLVLGLSLVLGGSFYLGVWNAEEGSMSFPNINRNVVALECVVGAALVTFLGRNGHLGKTMRWLWPIGLIGFALPVLYTASRKGAIALALVPLLYFGLTLRFARLGRLLIVLAIFAGIAIVAGDELSVTSVAPVERLMDRFEMGDTRRETLLDLSLRLVADEPWGGYGISSTFSPSWRVAHGFVNEATGDALSIHNGFLALALMGGVPFLAIYVILLGAAGAQAVRLAATSTSTEKCEMAAMSFVLLTVVIIAMLTGGGSEYWKFGWFTVGLVLLVGEVVRRSNDESQRPALPAPARKASLAGARP